MDKAFKAVQQLVKDFSNNETAYLAPNYQESRVRQDFVDKLFAALGWDVTHERQKNPYEQEVKIENRVQTGGSQRRADYAFFITPNFRDVKFFVEAKKPAHDLKKHDYYHQAIRYGWNQGTPLAVLTDFEEFHILDCRYKPNIETALEHSVKVYRYKDYADKEKFAEIFFLFGRDAVADGSLEKFAATLPKPRGKAIQKGLFKGGYQLVDEAFLGELDGYRETLAKAFKKENQELEGEELTEAVQRTIDRLVFIRFLEDKQIEEPAIIAFREKKSAWGAFLAHCRSLEPKYNGLVFKPHRILDGKEFNPPDDTAFADICNKLADPSSPYDFNHIPISILGSIYERFLGKVVHATEKRVSVEEKPEVRKAGGVYYTPEYIVRYIVNETVGKLIEGKTPDEISQMAFADIACGSGSFLIEVYSQLLEYHARYYAERPKAARKEDIAKREGKTVLSLKKRQEILTSNIYGVDIDFQATEVTQLSLYLKLLEDATTNDAYQFGLLKEKILPDLRNNIICGNSLIGTDILEGDLFGREEDKKLNPMNFADAFPKIMKRGGFDAIVGNPPYGAYFIASETQYFKNNYEVFAGAKDIYALFIEKSLKLLGKKGTLSFIVPSAWTGAVEYKRLREVFLHTRIERLVLLPFDVFKDAYIDTLVFKVTKTEKNGAVKTYLFPKKQKLNQITLLDQDYETIEQEEWENSEDKKFILKSDALDILKKIKLNTTLFSEVVNIKRGVLFDKTLLTPKKKGQNSFLYFEGDVYRYSLNKIANKWIVFDEKIKERPKEFLWFEGERILLRRLVNRKQQLMASITKDTFITNKNLYSVLPKNKAVNLKFVLGILNSKFVSYLYINQVTQATKMTFRRLQ